MEILQAQKHEHYKRGRELALSIPDVEDHRRVAVEKSATEIDKKIQAIKDERSNNIRRNSQTS